METQQLFAPVLERTPGTASSCIHEIHGIQRLEGILLSRDSNVATDYPGWLGDALGVYQRVIHRAW